MDKDAEDTIYSTASLSAYALPAHYNPSSFSGQRAEENASQNALNRF